MLHYNRIDIRKGIHVAKHNVANSKKCITYNVSWVWISRLFVMIVMIWCCVFILVILLLSLSKMLIITIIHDISISDIIHLLENSVQDDCGYMQNACQHNQC